MRELQSLLAGPFLAEEEPMAALNPVFQFMQCVSILKSTGRKARDLRELREILSDLGGNSLIHHTYQYFLKGHILEYTNDFAQWAGEVLEERALAEELSNIDPYEFDDMVALQKRFISVIDGYLERCPDSREVRAGDEFHFGETVSMVFPIGVNAKNLAELLVGVKYVDTGSIYYHFYEARRRLGGGMDDFSLWVSEVLNKTELAEKIRAIDPFMHSVDGIRAYIAQAIEENVKHDMEGIER